MDSPYLPSYPSNPGFGTVGIIIVSVKAFKIKRDEVINDCILKHVQWRKRKVRPTKLAIISDLCSVYLVY